MSAAPPRLRRVDVPGLRLGFVALQAMTTAAMVGNDVAISFWATAFCLAGLGAALFSAARCAAALGRALWWRALVEGGTAVLTLASAAWSLALLSSLGVAC